MGTPSNPNPPDDELMDLVLGFGQDEGANEINQGFDQAGEGLPPLGSIDLRDRLIGPVDRDSIPDDAEVQDLEASFGPQERVEGVESLPNPGAQRSQGNAFTEALRSTENTLRRALGIDPIPEGQPIFGEGSEPPQRDEVIVSRENVGRTDETLEETMRRLNRGGGGQQGGRVPADVPNLAPADQEQGFPSIDQILQQTEVRGAPEGQQQTQETQQPSGLDFAEILKDPQFRIGVSQLASVIDPNQQELTNQIVSQEQQRVQGRNLERLLSGEEAPNASAQTRQLAANIQDQERRREQEDRRLDIQENRVRLAAQRFLSQQAQSVDEEDLPPASLIDGVTENVVAQFTSRALNEGIEEGDVAEQLLSLSGTEGADAFDILAVMPEDMRRDALRQVRQRLATLPGMNESLARAFAGDVETLSRNIDQLGGRAQQQADGVTTANSTQDIESIPTGQQFRIGERLAQLDDRLRAGQVAVRTEGGFQPIGSQ